MAYDQSVRQYMVNKGYDNDRIGYDPSSGSVTYNGTSFLKPQKVYQGSSYSDQPTLDQADQTYKKNYGFMDSAENNMSVPERFAYYAGNPQAGQTELNRVNTKLNYLQAIGDQAGINSANQYRNSLMTTLGQNPNMSQSQQQYANNNQQIMDQLNYLRNFAQNQQQFDPYSSPQYQAAQAQANRGAQQNIRQAQESLGAAGFGRSTALQDEAQRYGNQAQEYLMTQVVPQIIQQHQAQQQQQYNNALNALGQLTNYNQNQFSNNRLNTQDERQRQQDHINLANQLSQAYGVPVEPKDDPALAYAQVQGLTPLNAQQVQSQLNLQKAQSNYYNDRGNYYDDRSGVSPSSPARSSSGVTQKPGSSQTPAPKSLTTDQLSQIMPELDAMQNNPYELRARILGLHLPDDQTLALLKRYGQGAKPPTSYSGGR